MNRDAALKLKTVAWQAAENFSQDREFNYASEKFIVLEIIPRSDNVAAVIMEKNTGKWGLFLFYYMNMGGGVWKYFALTDSHIMGIESRWLVELKQRVEEHNYPLNFVEEKLKVNV